MKCIFDERSARRADGDAPRIPRLRRVYSLGIDMIERRCMKPANENITRHYEHRFTKRPMAVILLPIHV